MFTNGNKDYYDVQGTLIYDPSTSYDVVQTSSKLAQLETDPQ